VVFESPTDGRIAVIVSPLVKLTRQKDARIEDIGSPEGILNRWKHAQMNWRIVLLSCASMLHRMMGCSSTARTASCRNAIASLTCAAALHVLLDRELSKPTS
jgi:hypothetical protein